jgi:cytochrome oxidase assembly protein ShyY1
MSGFISDILSQAGVELPADRIDAISQVMIDRGWIVSNFGKATKRPKIQSEKPKEKARINETREKIEKTIDQCKREGIKLTVRNIERISKIPKSTVAVYMKKMDMSSSA